MGSSGIILFSRLFNFTITNFIDVLFSDNHNNCVVGKSREMARGHPRALRMLVVGTSICPFDGGLKSYSSGTFSVLSAMIITLQTRESDCQEPNLLGR